MQRLTYPTALVLCGLARGYRYGFDLIDATGVQAGTIYPILRRLEDAGLVIGSWERVSRARAEGRPPRRNYRLTGAGEAVEREARGRYPGIERVFDGGRAGEAPAKA